jgi:hypothetical protein
VPEAGAEPERLLGVRRYQRRVNPVARKDKDAFCLSCHVDLELYQDLKISASETAYRDTESSRKNMAAKRVVAERLGLSLIEGLFFCGGDKRRDHNSSSAAPIKLRNFFFL